MVIWQLNEALQLVFAKSLISFGSSVSEILYLLSLSQLIRFVIILIWFFLIRLFIPSSPNLMLTFGGISFNPKFERLLRLISFHYRLKFLNHWFRTVIYALLYFPGYYLFFLSGYYV